MWTCVWSELGCHVDMRWLRAGVPCGHAFGRSQGVSLGSGFPSVGVGGSSLTLFDRRCGWAEMQRPVPRRRTGRGPQG
eukprot:364183-Chlamydomonas_euryale.AAC.28